MGGMEEEGKLFKVNNGGEIGPIRGWLKEEERVFIPSSKNVTVGATYTGFFGLRPAFSSPRSAFSRQISG
jgi:hypothetical protein